MDQLPEPTNPLQPLPQGGLLDKPNPPAAMATSTPAKKHWGLLIAIVVGVVVISVGAIFYFKKTSTQEIPAPQEVSAPEEAAAPEAQPATTPKVENFTMEKSELTSGESTQISFDSQAHLTSVQATIGENSFDLEEDSENPGHYKGTITAPSEPGDYGINIHMTDENAAVTEANEVGSIKVASQNDVAPTVTPAEEAAPAPLSESENSATSQPTPALPAPSPTPAPKQSSSADDLVAQNIISLPDQTNSTPSPAAESEPAAPAPAVPETVPAPEATPAPEAAPSTEATPVPEAQPAASVSTQEAPAEELQTAVVTPPAEQPAVQAPLAVATKVETQTLHGAYIRGKTGPEILLYPLLMSAANGLYFALRRRRK